MYTHMYMYICRVMNMLIKHIPISDVCELCRMSVNPNYRRGGVGAKLVQVCATVYLSMLQRVMYTYQMYMMGKKNVS